LRGIEPLFQAESELGLTEAQDAGAVRQRSIAPHRSADILVGFGYP